MTKPLLALLSATALLAACATSKPEASADTTAEAAPATCKADAADAYIGKAGDADTIDAVRKATGSTLVRALRPGDAATMDYRVERVNIYLDASGNIEKIGCG